MADVPSTTARPTPWMGLELGALQPKLFCSPGETENECLWRIPLMGGAQIVGSDKELNGFGGPGVVLSNGPADVLPWSALGQLKNQQR